jgi:ketosteroid isomerase-like protein
MMVTRLNPTTTSCGFVILCALNAAAAPARSADAVNSSSGPTVENAMAAERDLATAQAKNDADAVGRLLADDWAVVNAHGAMGRRGGFLDHIRSGALTRTKLELSDMRVRIYGDVAYITEQVDMAGIFGGKSFEVREMQTDILLWQNGAWKSVLTHETFIRD